MSESIFDLEKQLDASKSEMSEMEARLLMAISDNSRRIRDAWERVLNAYKDGKLGPYDDSLKIRTLTSAIQEAEPVRYRLADFANEIIKRNAGKGSTNHREMRIE